MTKNTTIIEQYQQSNIPLNAADLKLDKTVYFTRLGQVIILILLFAVFLLQKFGGCQH